MPMKRLLPIAASLALILAASAVAQDAAAPATGDPSQAAAAAAPAATETAAPAPATPAPAAITGDTIRGKGLTYTCRGCHGVTGYKNAYPSYHVPKIGGQSAEYLAQALTEYQKGGRKHPTMQAQSQSFSDQDIADLSAYLSSLK